MNKINIDIVFNAINKANTGIDQVTNRLGKVNTCMWKMNQMSELWGRMSDTMGQLSAPGVELEKNMAELSAITGIAGDDLKQLEKTARQVGRSSGLGASGAVEAYKLLASQIDVSKIGMDGLNVLQQKTITLAQASGLSLADSANALAGTINQFGLEADQADRVIQALAAGAKYGAAEVPDLAQSFKVVGAAAAVAGLSVEQTGGALETLSKMNIKGSEAGTALRNVLLKMQTDLGFDFKVTKLSDALKTLQGREGDAAYMAKIFGAENIAAAQFLVKNADTVDEMTASMTNTTTATEQAAIMNDTFAHRAQVLKAKLNDLSISFFNNNKGMMQMVEMGGQGAQMLTSLAPIGSFVSGSMGMIFKGAKGATSGIINTAKAARLMSAAMAAGKLGTYSDLIARYGAAGKVAAVGLKISTIAQGAWNAITGFTTATMVPLIASTWAWTAALLANPITWVVVGVAALIAGLALAWKHFDGFRGAVVGAWEGIKQFGVILYQSIVNPLKQIIGGIGTVGKAIGLMFKGKFGEAAATAKEGFASIAEGAVKSSPIGVAVQVASRRQEIVDKAAAGSQKGKAMTPGKGKKETADNRQETGNGINGQMFAIPKQGAVQPTMKVVKAPGMISPVTMPQPAGITVPGAVAMNAPSVPGMNNPGNLQVSPVVKPMPEMSIPGTIDAKQPEAKPMDIPGNVILNVQKIQALNFLGALSFAPPKKIDEKQATKATGGIVDLTKSITTNIQKNETNNSTANQTNNDSTAKIQVTYSPQINISSAMDAKATDDLMKMLADNKDELMKLINEEMRRNDRLRYAG